MEQSIREELEELFGTKIKNSTHELNYSKSILVLSGGGIKGIAVLGAVHKLEVMGLIKNITTYAGTSIGSYISLLLSIGYTADEIFEICEELDFSKIIDSNFSNLLTQYGLDDGKKMKLVIEKTISARNINKNITFLELFNKTNKVLYITASCINDKLAYYFSYKTQPDMKVIDAIMMSMAVPIMFSPIMYNNKIFVDGGCIDNYPVKLFENELDNVIGINVYSMRNCADNITNIEEYISHTIQCIFEGISINTIKGYDKCTININLKDISFSDIALDKKKKMQLFDIGFISV